MQPLDPTTTLATAGTPYLLALGLVVVSSALVYVFKAWRSDVAVMSQVTQALSAIVTRLERIETHLDAQDAKKNLSDPLFTEDHR